MIKSKIIVDKNSTLKHKLIQKNDYYNFSKLIDFNKFANQFKLIFKEELQRGIL